MRIRVGGWVGRGGETRAYLRKVSLVHFVPVLKVKLEVPMWIPFLGKGSKKEEW